MKTLNFSIVINAPREKVWNTMLEDQTYRIWTDPFHPGSYYEGSFDEGSTIRFLGPSEDGKLYGMLSEIAKNDLHEFVSIKHLGEIFAGEEKLYDTNSPAYENYKFSDVDGGTKVEVELVGLPDEYSDMFNQSWPKALEKLKEICQQ